MGRTGQVGWELQRALAPLGEVVALSRAEADLDAPDSLHGLVAAHAPEVVVNAAAYTAVDKAESEPEAAQRANATSVGLMAREAASHGALFVHFSTDYVFDGSGNQAWTETDTPNPLSVYGRTKLLGEKAVQSAGGEHLIFRTSWVYAARGRNFLGTILRLAAEREALTIVGDQVGAPTGADLIADVTAHAIAQVLAGASPPGLYHLAAAGHASWWDFARYIVERAGARGTALKVQAEGIAATTTAAYGAKAPRPLNSRLDTSRLQRSFGLTLPAWQTGVDRTITEILESRP